MSTKYRIEYEDNKSGIFYSSNTMRGKIFLTLAKPKKLSRIYLQIKGYAKTQWHTGSGKRRETHQGSEKYFFKKIDFIPETGGMQTIEPGNYEYDFSHYLPHNLPSSFESNIDGVKAFIRYTVKLVLVRQWRNQSFKEGFTVLNHYDLNTWPNLLRPETKSVLKHFTWDTKGPITVDFSIPMSGFVPGENIPISVKVKNESSKSESDFKIQLKLKQLIQANATSPYNGTKVVKRNVAITEILGIPKDQDRVYNAVIEVPAVPPTNTNLSSLIQIQYALYVKIQAFGTHTNERTSVPIVIGTIPFQGTLELSELWGGQRVVTVFEEVHNLPSYNEAIGSNEKQTEELPLPPPTYEESIFGDVDLENEDHTHFTPRYPVYHYDCLPSRPGELKGSVYKFQKF